MNKKDRHRVGVLKGIPCQFMLDVMHITLRLSRPKNLITDLSQYLRVGKTIGEQYAERPLMPGKFRKRTYFKAFNQVKKLYLIHEKCSPLSEIDAILIAHDLPFKEFQQIGWILEKLKSVNCFHLAKVELRWDYYPGDSLSAVELQTFFIKHLYLTNTQKAFQKGESPRITFYIGNGQSDAFVKVYIRPKKPQKGQKEFARIELTVNRRWMKKQKIYKPKDFINMNFPKLVQQLSWLTVDKKAVRRSYLNSSTHGHWLHAIKDTYKNGIAQIIINHRQEKTCPNLCKWRMDSKICSLIAKKKHSANDLFRGIQKCRKSRTMRDFQSKYCRPYQHHSLMIKQMQDAFEKWKTIHHDEIFKRYDIRPIFKSSYSVNNLKKTKKRKGKIMTKLKMPRLFKNSPEANKKQKNKEKQNEEKEKK